jgi:hypothetical protein
MLAYQGDHGDPYYVEFNQTLVASRLGLRGAFGALSAFGALYLTTSHKKY